MALKDKYFTISEAASMIGVTRQTISRWVAEGAFDAEKVGRQVLIERKEFGQYMVRQHLYKTAREIIIGLTKRIREKYNYTDEDTVEFLEIKTKKDIFVFSIIKKDGTREIVSVSVNAPEKLDDKGKSFLLLGYKIQIQKIVKQPYREEKGRK